MNMGPSSAKKDSISDSGSHTPPNNNVTALEDKISRAKRRIQEEQRRRDANVDEYLRTAATAPRTQLPQVKTVFEKRNMKAANHIAALQRKLERYQRDLSSIELDLETSPHNRSHKSDSNSLPLGLSLGSPQLKPDLHHGSEASGSSNASSHKHKGRLHHVSHGIKTVIGKPREIANLLKQKYGSADNIPAHVRDSDYTTSPPHLSSNDTSHNNSGGGGAQINQSGAESGVDDDGILGVGSECSASAKSSSLERDAKLPKTPFSSDSPILFIELKQQVFDLRCEVLALKEDLEAFKEQVSQDSTLIYQGLQEEKFRAERLEEQVNDLTELHQAETGNLKQALADAEEKLSYQSEERLRDLAELLDACQVKISRLEQQQQQLVTIEGIENSAARALVVKLVNIGLTMLQLLLLIVATTASTLAPFVGSRIRLLVSIFLGLMLFLAHRKWPHAHEHVLEFWSELLNKL